jgi:hypothetical protein
VRRHRLLRRDFGRDDGLCHSGCDGSGWLDARRQREVVDAVERAHRVARECVGHSRFQRRRRAERERSRRAMFSVDLGIGWMQFIELGQRLDQLFMLRGRFDAQLDGRRNGRRGLLERGFVLSGSRRRTTVEHERPGFRARLVER